MANENISYADEVSYSEIPDNAFIYENKCYFRKRAIKRKLPLTKKQNKEILDRLNIAYVEKADNLLEYFDSYIEEYDIISGPLYEEVAIGKYHYTGRSYSETFPSPRMIQVANFLTEKVEDEIKREETLREISSILEGRPSGFGVLSNYIEDGFFEFKDQEYYLFSIYLPTSEIRQRSYAIFNLDKIKEGDTVEMYIPNEYNNFKGWIIGKHGCNLKAWCNLLGLEKILIV